MQLVVHNYKIWFIIKNTNKNWLQIYFFWFFYVLFMQYINMCSLRYCNFIYLFLHISLSQSLIFSLFFFTVRISFWGCRFHETTMHCSEFRKNVIHGPGGGLWNQPWSFIRWTLPWTNRTTEHSRKYFYLTICF